MYQIRMLVKWGIGTDSLTDFGYYTGRIRKLDYRRSIPLGTNRCSSSALLYKTKSGAQKTADSLARRFKGEFLVEEVSNEVQGQE